MTCICTSSSVDEHATSNLHFSTLILLCIHVSDAEVYCSETPERPHGQPNSEAVVHMGVVKTSDIEMTQNQVYGARVPLASAAGHDTHDGITMEANVGYGVTKSHQ